MAWEDTNTYRKLTFPPLFGRPKEKQVSVPSTIRPPLYLVPLDAIELRALKIQTIPLEVSVDPTPKWAVIPSIARNNPFYHYTGGEDKLSFTLDWYSERDNRQDVIQKCRWVEALSKGDGYLKGPSRVLLIFGDLFKTDSWIIESAPYKLSLFDTSRELLPRQAYQELTLNKVSDHNTTRKEVLSQGLTLIGANLR